MTFYDDLGVNSDASEQAIKSAYRRLSLQYHPDKNKNLHGAELEAVVSLFQKINNAYEVLGDADARHEYDDSLEFMARRSTAIKQLAWNHNKMTKPHNKKNKVERNSLK